MENSKMSRRERLKMWVSNLRKPRYRLEQQKAKKLKQIISLNENDAV